MKKMIVLTDFSDASRNAGRYAVSLAKEFEASVTLLNVTPPSAVVHDSMFASVMITQAEILQENKELMVAEIDRLLGLHGKKVTGFVKEGYISDTISALVSEENTDLVVMGMKGKGKSNSVFGSTTTTLVRKSDFSILLVPEEAEYNCIKSITYASDFNTSIEMERFATLIKIAENFSAPLSILHVEKSDQFTQADALGKLKTSVQFSRLKPEFHSIRENDVVKGISKFMEQNPCSILTMVAHKHSLFERIFGKVITREMSLQSKVPLLILHGK